MESSHLFSDSNEIKMDKHLSLIITFFQLIGIPILLLIYHSIRKIHRGNKFNGYKITALVHAMQMETQNGFTECYNKKLEDLIKEAKFIEDKQ